MKLNSKKECSHRSTWETLLSTLSMKLSVSSQWQSRQVTCRQQQLHSLCWTVETISWMELWSSRLMPEHAKKRYNPIWWKHRVHLEKWPWIAVQMSSQLDLLQKDLDTVLCTVGVRGQRILNSVLFCLRDWWPCPYEPDLSIRSTNCDEVHFCVVLQCVLQPIVKC